MGDTMDDISDNGGGEEIKGNERRSQMNCRITKQNSAAGLLGRG
jgi:hypothetical protein